MYTVAKDEISNYHKIYSKGKIFKTNYILNIKDNISSRDNQIHVRGLKSVMQKKPRPIHFKFFALKVEILQISIIKNLQTEYICFTNDFFPCRQFESKVYLSRQDSEVWKAISDVLKCFNRNWSQMEI